jgi:hypothetical protein
MDRQSFVNGRITCHISVVSILFVIFQNATCRPCLYSSASRTSCGRNISLGALILFPTSHVNGPLASKKASCGTQHILASCSTREPPVAKRTTFHSRVDINPTFTSSNRPLQPLLEPLLLSPMTGLRETGSHNSKRYRYQHMTASKPNPVNYRSLIRISYIKCQGSRITLSVPGLFSRPRARVILVHPLDEFVARRGPALDAPLQNYAFHLIVTTIRDVVAKPASSSRAAPA